jgi:hypothetical protein
MKQTIRIAIVGVMALALGALLQPAWATCGNPNFFHSCSSTTADCSYLQTPGVGGGGIGGSGVTANLRGNFWALGNGAPAGEGHDDGSGGANPAAWPALEGGIDFGAGATGWVKNFQGAGYVGASLYATWAEDPRIDGCTDSVAVQPVCHATFLTDHNGADTFFAVLSKLEDQGNYDFSRPGDAPITLAPVPKPRITGSSRTGNDVTLQIGAPLPPDLTAGSYLDPACGPVITGYRVRGRIVPRGSGVGAGRDPAEWTSFQTAVIPIGNGTSVVADCSEVANQDVYIAQTFIFDSGFEATYVSRESTRAECGPQVAEPQQPQRQRPGRR